MFYPKFRNDTRFRANFQITAPTVRLLSDDGKQIGVMSLSEAKQQSVDTGLDLVEVGPNAKPPVVKLISFSKFKYQEAKRQQAEKKGGKGGDIKELQMTPFIGQGDYETRLKKAKEFLTTGNKIKLSIKFQGRQITKKEFGYQLVDRFKADLVDFAALEGEAKLLGKRLFQTFTPLKKSKNKADQPVAEAK